MSSDATAGQTPDLYGQLHPVETPELLESKLEEFRQELDKLNPEETEWATQAAEKCPSLTESGNDFKIMFLRCEVFNADLAAARYAAYWKKRVAIFGPEKAFLPLTLDAALDDPKIQTALNMGVMTLMEGVHDPSGRAIVYFDPSQYDKTKYTLETVLPAFWYVLHAALGTESAQQKGVIFIGDPGRASMSQFDRAVAKELIGSLKGALPIRLSAFHMVHPPAFAKVVLPVIKLFMSDRMKKRICIHSGKEDKVLETLQAKYGLTKEMLPTTIGGTYKVQHAEWVQKRSSSGL
ncbi:MAG: hypothetical protein SGARI_003035 [Bacillariaceae sp.]